MAARNENHPSDKVIQAFGQGRLPLAEATRLEGHFAQCGQCGEKLAQVAADTYSELLRQPPPHAFQQPLAETVSEVGPSLPTSAPSQREIPIPPELQSHPRYTIQRQLGTGGMGVVYQAQHRIMQRPVALKMIRPDLLATPMAVSRFRREVQAAARLAHPNIVTAFDAEEVAGVHFFVMEYVSGQSLEQRVRENGPLPIPQACELARQIALGLHHAHGQDMVHRDIKPANVMVTDEEAVKILDFGLARWSDGGKRRGSLTRLGARLGTVNFAAPEQLLAADQADARADQYGLGATLYYLLTGKPPPPPEPTGEKDPSADPLPDLPPTLPPGLRRVLTRLLAYAPKDRFPSAQAAAVALAPFCSEPGKQTGSRRRWLAPVLVLAAATLAGLLWWQLSGRGQTGDNPDGPGKESEGSAAGPLLEKKQPILFLLPSDGLWYEDYHPPRLVLEKAGFPVQVATAGRGPSFLHPKSMAGKPDRPDRVAADLDLAGINADHFSALILVGYHHAEFTAADTPTGARALQLLHQADRSRKWLVGICAGQNVLGAAGLLKGKRVARQAPEMVDLRTLGALPQPEQNVAVDGRIITASSPADAADAAIELVRLLKKR